MNAMKRLWVAAAAALLLSACGGGGNDAAPLSVDLPPEPATIGVLLTDAYGTRWDQAIATITSIELIGDDAHETLFSGMETIDLLSLGDYSELLAVTEIFPLKLSKIRLHLLSLELVDLDDMGMEIERVTTKLVGNGKIDIKPRGEIVVAGGDTLLVEIDFDMNKSFKTTETGSGKLIVRPVIFARITTSGSATRMTRVFGTVASLDADAQSFVLCQTRLAGSDDDDDDSDDDGDDAFDHCIGVATDDRTAVFGADGLPVTFADIAVEMELTAVGFLRHVAHDDSDSDDDGDDSDGDDDDGDDDGDHGDEMFDDDFVLDAVVIELGTDFERFAGTVETDVAESVFDFSLNEGQGFDPGTIVSTELFANTRVFARDGTELDQNAIVTGATGIVDGVLSPGGEGQNDHLSAALVVLDPAEADAEVLLSGSVISVQVDDGTFDLMTGGVPRCVRAGMADIQLVSDVDGTENTPGDLTDLTAGVAVDVFGHEGVEGCFDASSVLVHTNI